MADFYLIWQEAEQVLKSDTEANNLAFSVSFPGYSTEPHTLLLSTHAPSSEILKDVTFSLCGEDADVVQNLWPALGGPERPDLAGGFEISFDGGRVWQRFSSTNPTIPLAKAAVGASGADGQLGPMDVAYLTVRLVIPPGITDFKIYHVELTPDFNVF